MNFPFNFIVIPAVIIVTAVIGSKYVKQGLKPWYKELRKPSWTPSGKLIGEIWFFLYTITGLGILWYWNVPVAGWLKYVVGVILLINAYYNAHWNKVFFINRDIRGALRVMMYLNISGILATVLIYIDSPIASFLMLPYIIWVGIATHLTKQIAIMNQKK